MPVGDAFHIRIYDAWASSSSKSKTYFRMRSVLSRSSRLSSERSFLGCAVIVRNAGRVVCQTEVAPYDQRGEGLKKNLWHLDQMGIVLKPSWQLSVRTQHGPFLARFNTTLLMLGLRSVGVICPSALGALLILCHGDDN